MLFNDNPKKNECQCIAAMLVLIKFMIAHIQQKSGSPKGLPELCFQLRSD